MQNEKHSGGAMLSYFKLRLRSLMTHAFLLHHSLSCQPNGFNSRDNYRPCRPPRLLVCACVWCVLKVVSTRVRAVIHMHFLQPVVPELNPNPARLERLDASLASSPSAVFQQPSLRDEERRLNLINQGTGKTSSFNVLFWCGFFFMCVCNDAFPVVERQNIIPNHVFYWSIWCRYFCQLSFTAQAEKINIIKRLEKKNPSGVEITASL